MPNASIPPTLLPYPAKTYNVSSERMQMLSRTGQQTFRLMIKAKGKTTQEHEGGVLLPLPFPQAEPGPSRWGHCALIKPS